MSNPYDPTTPHNYGPPQTPKKKHHWYRPRNVFLACVAFIVLIVVITVAASSGSSPKTTNHVQAGSAQPAAKQPAYSAPSIPAAGTAVRDGKFQFKITSVTHAKSAGDSYVGETAQGEFTILHVTVTNISSQAQTLDDSSQYVYDGTGRKYDADSVADIDLGSESGANSVWLESINPGNTVQGQIAFDLPTGTKAVKAELHDSAFSGGVTVQLP